jgi:hypothetical protein
MSFKLFTSFTAVCVFLSSPVFAEILVNEPFAGYEAGALIKDPARLGTSGQPTTGKGLAGQWAGINGTGQITLNGLEFGSSYPTSGGALAILADNKADTPQDSNISVSARLQIKAPVVGTLWASYLFRTSAVPSTLINSQNEVRTNAASSLQATSWFRSQATSYNGPLAISYTPVMTPVPKPLEGTVPDYIQQAPVTLKPDTTYLIISRFTNVGTALPSAGASANGEATLYVLTQEQYETLYRLNKLTESGLGNASIGGGAENIYCRANGKPAATGLFEFKSGNLLQIASFNASQIPITVTFDEVRFATSLESLLKP